MKHIFILLSIALGCCVSIHGQDVELSKHVLSNGGNTVNTGDIIVSWTLGEPMGQIIQTDDFLLTMSFQTGSLEVSTQIEDLESLVSIKVFPNPTTGQLFIEASPRTANLDLHWELFDVQGKSIQSGTQQVLSDMKINISLLHLSEGIYTFRMTDTASQLQNSYRIVKVN